MRLDSDKLQSDSYIADNYIAIYYLGGRGPLNDLPECKPNTELANKVRTNIMSKPNLHTRLLVLPLWKAC